MLVVSVRLSLNERQKKGWGGRTGTFVCFCCLSLIMFSAKAMASACGRKYIHSCDNTVYISKSLRLWNTHLCEDPYISVTSARDKIVTDFKFWEKMWRTRNVRKIIFWCPFHWSIQNATNLNTEFSFKEYMKLPQWQILQAFFKTYNMCLFSFHYNWAFILKKIIGSHLHLGENSQSYGYNQGSNC